jgi:hypothetical protein
VNSVSEGGKKKTFLRFWVILPWARKGKHLGERGQEYVWRPVLQLAGPESILAPWAFFRFEYPIRGPNVIFPAVAFSILKVVPILVVVHAVSPATALVILPEESGH